MRSYGTGPRRERRFSFFRLLVLLVIVASVPAALIAYRMTDRSAPLVNLVGAPKAIGRSTKITIETAEPRYGIREARAVLVQADREFPLASVSNPATPWWRLRRGEAIRPSLRLEGEAGSERMPQLKEGPVTIRAEATNDSPARFGKGRTTRVEVTLPVLLKPPRVEVLSGQHYINQGGSECVLYRASESTEVSGVRAGKYFFHGYPKTGGAPGERFAFFAFPYDLSASTVPVLVARDAAGNETVASFPFKLFPKRFRDANIDLTDDFLRRVVPAILSESPSIKSQGDLLKDFLEINSHLRRDDAAALVDLSGKSRTEFLWKGPFIQLGSSKVMASFADHRSYVYRGRVVDHQDHLGFDLAVTANHPVDAANDGVVLMARFFGIYGNTVVIDHGYGLMTLYSHLSSIDVKEGQPVRRGDPIGRSGATGLAGGDHLHFSVLLQGVPVDPREWWDAHWIRDRIESKIGPRA